MFERLIESRPVRRRATAQLALSTGLHAGVLLLAVAATRGAAAPRDDRRPPPASFVVAVPPGQVATAATGAVAGAIVSAATSLPAIAIPGVVPNRVPLPPAGGIDLPHTGGSRRFGMPGDAVDAGAVIGVVGRRVVVADRTVEPMAGPKPTYPEALRRARIAGSVRVRFIVDRQGSVDSASVEVLSSSHPAFDLPAVRAVRQWRFRPAQVGDEAVDQLVTQLISFRLDE